MSEFSPGDVWRRETKADTELLVLRSETEPGRWRCVALSIGKVSGYAATIEATLAERDLAEMWTPLVEDPEHGLRRMALAARDAFSRFAEECDPWMTPSRAEHETRPPTPRKKLLIVARNYLIAKGVAQERGLTRGEWQSAAGPNATRGYAPDVWDLVVHDSAWELPDLTEILSHLRASGFEVPDRG